jgi:hypothetical protein
MPRATMRKVDLLAKLYKLKTSLYNEHKEGSADDEWYDGAHHALNQVLDHLQEYSE